MTTLNTAATGPGQQQKVEECSAKGFTLVELPIVVVILGVLSSGTAKFS